MIIKGGMFFIAVDVFWFTLHAFDSLFVGQKWEWVDVDNIVVSKCALFTTPLVSPWRNSEQ